MHPVAKSLRRIEEVAAAEHGVNMWQYAILSVVIEAPGLNQSEVAKRLQYSVNRIIGDLDVLADRGLLTRRTGDDRGQLAGGNCRWSLTAQPRASRHPQARGQTARRPHGKRTNRPLLGPSTSLYLTMKMTSSGIGTNVDSSEGPLLNTDSRKRITKVFVRASARAMGMAPGSQAP